MIGSQQITKTANFRAAYDVYSKQLCNSRTLVAIEMNIFEVAMPNKPFCFMQEPQWRVTYIYLVFRTEVLICCLWFPCKEWCAIRSFSQYESKIGLRLDSSSPVTVSSATAVTRRHALLSSTCEEETAAVLATRALVYPEHEVSVRKLCVYWSVRLGIIFSENLKLPLKFYLDQ